jgi:hypothetical protein
VVCSSTFNIGENSSLGASELAAERDTLTLARWEIRRPELVRFFRFFFRFFDIGGEPRALFK